MTKSVMTSQLASNDLQSTERHFGLKEDFDHKLSPNDNHLSSTTNACQHVLSPIGSANSSLSSDDNETKQRPNSHSVNHLIDFDDQNQHKCSVGDDHRPDESVTKQTDDPLNRIVLDSETLMSLNAKQLRDHWTEQQVYIDYIESQLRQLSRDKSDLISLRESEEKLKQQQLEANRRENVLVMRLTTKEQEMQEYLNQIQELKQSQVPTGAQLQNTLIDPAINLMFDKMKKEVDSSRAKVEEMQSELNAWKFTPDSTTGKRLMSKCRLLYQENEELGKMIESGRIAKLEGELSLQKNFSEELKKSQSEIDEFLLELDEDVEGMQNTIYYLQQQLKEAKEKLAKYEANSQIDNKCVQNLTKNSDNNSLKAFERTFQRNSDSADGVNTSDHTLDNELNAENITDDEIVDCVNSTEELNSVVNKKSNSNSEQSVVNEEINSSNDNYLSVNKTTNNVNNNKRTSSCEDKNNTDSDYTPPVVKVAKLSDDHKSQNNAIDLCLKSSDPLNCNTLKTKCIEINGQTNQ